MKIKYFLYFAMEYVCGIGMWQPCHPPHVVQDASYPTTLQGLVTAWACDCKTATQPVNRQGNEQAPSRHPLGLG